VTAHENKPANLAAWRKKRMAWLQPVTLRSSRITLAPLDPRHRDELIEAVNDGELFKLWYTSVPAPETMGPEIARRISQLASGSMLPFAIIDNASGQAVGMTNYLNVDSLNRRVEIGATWYRKSLQRTDVNTQAKLLLLGHAFETLDCIAVEFRTHFFNHQSRRAIERLGAKLDGILRSHQLAANGTLRDTCVYSIVASEWPAVKAHLSWQLTRPRDTPSP
jgi:N-acetyltransferase